LSLVGCQLPETRQYRQRAKENLWPGGLTCRLGRRNLSGCFSLGGSLVFRKGAFSMPTILVVDDSAVDRRLAAGLLSKIPNVEIAFAEDGLDALAQMKKSEPDVVLTDLQMPKFDGLKLVQAAALHHSGVPVVLMTRRGSEEIAVDALKQGAASYVPKAQLAERLEETITTVLARKDCDRSYERLIACSSKTEFDFRLENDPALVDPLIDLLQQIAVSMGVCSRAERLRLGLVIEEALVNAMIHGNLELSNDDLESTRESLVTGGRSAIVERRSQPPYRDRRVDVRIRFVPGEVRLTIADEGPGFDVSGIAEATDAAAIEDEAGRGLVLMRTFMDEVTFNEAGNEVTLVKRRTS